MINNIRTFNNEILTFIRQFNAAYDDDISTANVDLNEFRSLPNDGLKYYDSNQKSSYTSHIYKFKWSFDITKDMNHYQSDPALSEFIQIVDLNLYRLLKTRSLIETFLTSNAKRFQHIKQLLHDYDLTHSRYSLRESTTYLISLLTFICCHHHLQHISTPAYVNTAVLIGEPEEALNKYSYNSTTKFYISTLYNTYFMPCSSWVKMLIHISLSSAYVYQTDPREQYHYTPIYTFSRHGITFNGICVAWTSINKYLLIPPNIDTEPLYWAFNQINNMNNNHDEIWKIQSYCCSLFCCLIPKSYIRPGYQRLIFSSKSLINESQNKVITYIENPNNENGSVLGFVSSFGSFQNQIDKITPNFIPKYLRYFHFVCNAQTLKLIKTPFDKCVGLVIERFKLLPGRLELYSGDGTSLHSVLLFKLIHPEINEIINAIDNVKYNQDSIKRVNGRINGIRAGDVSRWLEANDIREGGSYILPSIVSYFKWYLMYSLFRSTKHEPLLIKIINKLPDKDKLLSKLINLYELKSQLIQKYTNKDYTKLLHDFDEFKTLIGNDETMLKEFAITINYYKFQIFHALYCNYDFYNVHKTSGLTTLQDLEDLNHDLWERFVDMKHEIIAYFNNSLLQSCMTDFEGGFNSFFIFASMPDDVKSCVLMICDINYKHVASLTLCHMIQPHNNYIFSINMFYELVYCFNNVLSNSSYVKWVMDNVEHYLNSIKPVKVAGGSNGETSNAFILFVICFMLVVVSVIVVIIVYLNKIKRFHALSTIKSDE